jgi:hypothetical protein
MVAGTMPAKALIIQKKEYKFTLFNNPLDISSHEKAFQITVMPASYADDLGRMQYR